MISYNDGCSLLTQWINVNGWSTDPNWSHNTTFLLNSPTMTSILREYQSTRDSHHDVTYCVHQLLTFTNISFDGFLDVLVVFGFRLITFRIIIIIAVYNRNSLLCICLTFQLHCLRLCSSQTKYNTTTTTNPTPTTTTTTIPLLLPLWIAHDGERAKCVSNVSCLDLQTRVSLS